MKLKAFEIFLKRREEVLNDIEKYLEILHMVKIEIESGEESNRPNFNRFSREYFHEGLILFHKIKGANFGNTAMIFATTFWSIIGEPLGKNNLNKDQMLDWILRIQNTLSALYGIAHSTVNSEIESITLPFYKKIIKHYRIRKESRKPKKSKKNKQIDM